jgi:hypothetical protein
LLVLLLAARALLACLPYGHAVRDLIPATPALHPLMFHLNQTSSPNTQGEDDHDHDDHDQDGRRLNALTDSLTGNEHKHKTLNVCPSKRATLPKDPKNHTTVPSYKQQNRRQ